MVRYYGRAKTRVGSVNTNQLGLKMSGCPSKIGKQGVLVRYQSRRAQCNQKFIGPVYYHGQMWSFNNTGVERAPRTQSFNSGVGHINAPRFGCAPSCSTDLTVTGTANNWSKIGNDLDGDSKDQAGRSVALSSDGTIVAVGAYGHDGGKGTARVYKWDGSNWSQIGNDLDGDKAADFPQAGDQAGVSVALSSDGTIVAVGAHYHDNKGTVRVYKWNGSEWNRLGEEGDLDGDRAGSSVALSSDGTILAVGAASHDSYKGTARVYKYSPDTTPKRSQIGNDLDGEQGGVQTGDYAGVSVALTSDGTIVAVGALYHDSDKGTARVYKLVGSNWSKIGNDLDGEQAGDLVIDGDGAGRSVALSSDGTIVAVGAEYHDNYKGTARVYSMRFL